MTIGAEIPFRRPRRDKDALAGTGSLIFDRQRDSRQREAQGPEEPMRVWSNGHFVET